jgi:serine/threonine protein phosphatase 1
MNDTSNRCFVIGDVHGHYQGLMMLLEAIAPGKQDQVYFLGDLIDRGPESYQVVEWVKQQPYPCLLGNHEQMMLNALLRGKADPDSLFSWFYSGGQDTLDSYPSQNHDRLVEHLSWMQTLPSYIDLGELWLVHAGVDPTLSIAEQTPEHFCWIRHPFHQITAPYFPDKLIVTGHTITFTFPGVMPGQLAAGKGWLDIDTGAYHLKSGWMTALEWTQKLVYQVNIFNQQIRVRPLAEAMTEIKPQQI